MKLIVARQDGSPLTNPLEQAIGNLNLERAEDWFFFFCMCIHISNTKRHNVSFVIDSEGFRMVEDGVNIAVFDPETTSPSQSLFSLAMEGLAKLSKHPDTPFNMTFHKTNEGVN